MLGWVFEVVLAVLVVIDDIDIVVLVVVFIQKPSFIAWSKLGQ